MGIFANCHILASALPLSKKSSTRQFLCLDLVNINVYITFIEKSHMAEEPRPILICSHVLLRRCLGQTKMAFGKRVLARSCQYLSVCQKL